MANGIKKSALNKSDEPIVWSSGEGWSYPTGMVWCPMKMSGMAILKCAELQKEFGCGRLSEFLRVARAKPESVPFRWPWLRHRRECPERAPEKEVRELRLELTPLKLIENSRKNPRAYRCPVCGGDKAFTSRKCRRCWRVSAKR